MNRITTKRVCAVCGVRTTHFRTFDTATGQPVLECDGCATQVTLVTRPKQLDPAVEALWNELTGENQ